MILLTKIITILNFGEPAPITPLKHNHDDEQHFTNRVEYHCLIFSYLPSVGNIMKLIITGHKLYLVNTVITMATTPSLNKTAKNVSYGI